MKPEQRQKMEAVRREGARGPRKIAKRLNLTLAEVRKAQRQLERRQRGPGAD